MVACTTPALTNSAAQCQIHNPISWPSPPVDWAAQLGAEPLPTGSSRGFGRKSQGAGGINAAFHGDQPAPVVHVWAASLEVAPGALDTFARLLSPDEQARAARFH